MSESDERIKQYVVGFLFSSDWSTIALLRKQYGKPEQSWQAGKLNGIGGKVEEGEEYPHAMRREGFEETRLKIDWVFKGAVIGDGWRLEVYAGVADLQALPIINDVGESFELIQLSEIDSSFSMYNMVDNLRYLIPLCQDENVQFHILDSWKNPND